jgi:hypothetical protein
LVCCIEFDCTTALASQQFYCRDSERFARGAALHVAVPRQLAGLWLAFEQGTDGHGMTVAQSEIGLQLVADLGCLCARRDRAACGEAARFGHTVRIMRRLAGPGLNVVEIGLK